MLPMPVPTIFLIDDGGEIVEMSDQPYDSERLFQELLAKYPNVLAGDQMSGSAPLKWLLVAREAGIPDTDGGTDRFSLDHLFIDQNGVPTFVEVKRSTDTRIRREVVGQMLDYAANASSYWRLETIRDLFQETCGEADPDVVIAGFLGAGAAPDASVAISQFWSTVETNLRAGNVRLIFAADEIPPELRRIVEFLNQQMNPAEVLAIEIRQYVGKGVRTLVPSVIGQPKHEKAEATRPGAQWNRESFLKALQDRCGNEVVVIVEAIAQRVGPCCPTSWFGNGRMDGSWSFGILQNGVKYPPFSLWTSGVIQFQFGTLLQRGIPATAIDTLSKALNEIPDVEISDDALNRFPMFKIAVLKEPGKLARFIEAIEAFVAQIKTTPEASSATASS